MYGVESDACPATSVVLIVLDCSDTEGTLSAARWLVQQGDNGPAGAGLRASLSCLYCWLYDWHGTPALGDWVMAFIKALEVSDAIPSQIRYPFRRIAFLIIICYTGKRKI